MKKILLCAMFLCLGATLVRAQNDDVDPHFLQPNFLQPSLHVGVVAGMSNNTLVLGTAYADDYHYDPRKGFAAGLSARLTLVDFPNSGNSLFLPDFSLRADLLLIQKNYKFYRNFSTSWIDLSYLYDVRTNNYLDLPLMAELRWGRSLHLSLAGGFYLGGWLTAHRAGKTFSLDDLAYGDRQYADFDEPVEFNAKRDNRLDAGWAYGFGAGFTVKKVDVSLDARWYYGLTDVQKNYMTFMNHRYNTTFSLQGGVSIQL